MISEKERKISKINIRQTNKWKPTEENKGENYCSWCHIRYPIFIYKSLKENISYISHANLRLDNFYPHDQYFSCPISRTWNIPTTFFADSFAPSKKKTKRGVLSMTLNCIRWWGSSSGDLRDVKTTLCRQNANAW